MSRWWNWTLRTLMNARTPSLTHMTPLKVLAPLSVSVPAPTL